MLQSMKKGTTLHLFLQNRKLYKFLICRFSVFKSSLFALFRNNRAQSLGLTRVQEGINAENVQNPFSLREITTAINRMTEDNQIMLSDGIVFLI